GLGIGGIAVALAVQSVLSDFIAAVLILVDKPFVVGDFIVVGDHLGTVESIGIKTTRLKSLGGESLIFPNSDLVKARIRNYRTLRERRISFNIAVVHDTAAEQVAAIPQLIRETVEELDTIRFDRAHFKGPDDGSLLFEVVYFVLDPDFALFMDRQQSISLGIMRRFAERGIELALPTRKVLLPGPSVTPPQP
ncbi:MAG: mechanosensitive ion channel domain-containing protein, partial [Myxococcota bacterium]